MSEYYLHNKLEAIIVFATAAKYSADAEGHHNEAFNFASIVEQCERAIESDRAMEAQRRELSDLNAAYVNPCSRMATAEYIAKLLAIVDDVKGSGGDHD